VCNAVSRVASALRDGDYLTRERATAWACLLLTGYACSIAFLGLTAHGLNDYAGRPLGTDFSNVYAAGVAASHGHASSPFDIVRQRAEEQAIFGAATPLFGWHYPPFFLLVAVALAQLPYLLALVVWQAASLLLYLSAIWLLIRKSVLPSLTRDRLWLVLSLGFTAVWVNLTHGQNGFLTCALFGSGIAILDERPVLAGVLFGLLCYKPQFASVIPIVLVATSRWRTLVALLVTVVMLAVAVTVVFGPEVWFAFLDSTHFTRVVVLEQGNTGFYKMQSVFAWVRMWGGAVWSAYTVQAVVDISVAVALVRVWQSSTSTAKKGAALCLAAILMTPYSLDYDLMLLAPAIALLAVEGLANKFEAYERTVLTALWLLPIASRTIAHTTSIPLAAPIMLLAFFGIHRTRAETCRASVDIGRSNA
jgi:hypothetical protein